MVAAKMLCELKGHRGFGSGGSNIFFIPGETSDSMCEEQLEKGRNNSTYTCVLSMASKNASFQEEELLPPSALFAFAEECQRGVEWSDRHVVSWGGCVTLFANRGEKCLRMRILRPCSRRNFELIVSSAPQWRDHQMHGMLSDGHCYAKYCNKVGSTDAWAEVGQEVAVVTSWDGTVGTFFISDLKVHELMLESEEPELLLIGFRCHQDGKAQVNT